MEDRITRVAGRSQIEPEPPDLDVQVKRRESGGNQFDQWLFDSLGIYSWTEPPVLVSPEINGWLAMALLYVALPVSMLYLLFWALS